MSVTINTFPAVTGYVSSIWDTILQTINYCNTNISASNLTTAETLAAAGAETMRNGRDSIDMYNLWV